MRPKPILLLILDGWGDAPPAEDNAISQAKCPNWRRIRAQWPGTQLRTDGLAVGLPDGQMGNSEVGHMNLGAGRIVYQDLTRVDAAIADGSFASNPALAGAARAAAASGRTLHVLGLLSPGGVHSHEDQILALLGMAAGHGARIAVHAFLDGRDTPPRSAAPSIDRLAATCAGLPDARIASVGGRYFGMDRDQRWDRVERAWRAMVDADAAFDYADAASALAAAYARGENDEFVQPCTIGGGCRIEDGDVVVFMNFRADRARQLTAAFVRADFAGFAAPRRPRLAQFVSLTEYAADLATTVAFPPQSMAHTLPEVLADAGMAQLRIAETEKYAHVTFFFSGGREAPYPGEERILVPSPKVATYDLQPEMSCPEVTAKLVAAIASRRFDFIVCNLANPDMVGHTGDLGAAIKAVEAVDAALGALETAVLAAGGEMLITADHGNLEDMWDEASGQANTQHSTNPVPLVYVGRPAALRECGALRDIAPTVLALMGLPQPVEMTGRPLVELREGA
ncbi:MAG: 2,3-bisphosphoglycerate-independent phosphoglycerate mutase [Rhodanobacteraceae bacterium]|nr:2,3-bisphosphoglycerate-independent phosphoglycerate mutase [Rhodanobacteraceae bacterium]